MNIRQLADRILADGKLSKMEHETLLNFINADGKLDEDENEQVTRILDKIKSGELTVE